MKFGFLSESSFFFLVVCQTLRVSFFLSWLLLIPSFLFLFPFISFASAASSAFMYFWAFRSNSVTIFGGLLVIEKKKSPCSNLTWKVIKMTWSSASSTYSSSLLNQVMYYLSHSSSACWMLRRWPIGFLCLCLPKKWRTKPLLSCLKSVIVPKGILLNHTLAAPFSVVRNALHITSSGVICNSISVLNDTRDPWNRHTTPTMGDEILVGGNGLALL